MRCEDVKLPEWNSVRAWVCLRARGILLLSLGLLAVACGGGGSSDPAVQGDNTPPTLSITDDMTNLVAKGPVTFTFTFSEPIQATFDQARITVAGGTAGAFTRVGDLVSTLVVTPTANQQGTLTVSVPAGAYQDLAGNANVAASAASQGYDTTPVIPTSTSLTKNSTRFMHFKYQVNADGSLASVDTSQQVASDFETYVLENNLLRVTVLPGFGGRVLSIIYKPTNSELLYQNPVGTVYGIGQGNFYYDYLMVYGGIFPTFPEPEHGKTWCLPWTVTVLEDTTSRVAIQLAFTDNLEPFPGVPSKFNNGKTGLVCTMTVALEADSARLDLDFTLTNPASSPVTYEYWTCQTYAPGSTPGNTYSPLNTKIVVPIQRVIVADGSWPWMGSAEQSTGSSHEFYYQNLSLYQNWTDMGIAYASPGVVQPWYGVVNRSNNQGVVRISENVVTPGLKFWTWGKGSLNNNPNNPGDPARSYIELWAGHGSQFFQDHSMAALAVKAWRESYYPTFGLDDYTKASQAAACKLTRQGTTLTALVSTAMPGATVTGAFFSGGTLLASSAKTAASGQADAWSYTGAETGLSFRLLNAQNQVLLEVGE